MAIWVTGDIHGDPTRFSTENFPEQKEMTKDDIMVILGDFGLVWNYEIESKEETYWLNWLDAKPFTTVFIDGNHENFDRLKTYPVETWHGGNVQYIRPSILHLMRGQIFEIEGKTFFTFGGASSHDISDGILEPDDPKFHKKRKILNKQNAMYRINHLSWWQEELPTKKEMDEGLENLTRQNHTVDYILTHSPYTSILRQMDHGSGCYQPDYLSNYLERIKQTTTYKTWLFGHMHTNETFYWDHTIAIYDQITRII